MIFRNVSVSASTRLSCNAGAQERPGAPALRQEVVSAPSNLANGRRFEHGMVGNSCPISGQVVKPRNTVPLNFSRRRVLQLVGARENNGGILGGEGR